ncbi:putative Ig domain-containing protein [Pedobacter sp. Hv1]|uniref:Ig-like domain-containing protein n=1 Tax=Pedobacter sp. Hv1 TaxID=1740090 RepID=UPI0006D88CE4|nr:putative Ig domain-containing protein [Pedobacter sp. Hv1]KQC00757.1 hypothetical protein AQF98_08745 [Pedobacter sp. Hv1]
MKLTSTYSTKLIKTIIFLFSIIVITLISNLSYAQTKILANTATVKSNPVQDPNNAILDDDSFAIVKSGGSLLGGGPSGELELKFASTIPANKTTFIRIDFDADVLNALLGGNLGTTLADVLGTVVLGNHYFNVGARNSAGNDVLTGSSSGGFSSSNLRLVKDASGKFYVAITPENPYDRVYIKDVTSALLLGSSNQTKVYNAFYISGTGSCDPAFATDFEGTGLTVSLLGVGKAGVTNMQNAIDNNSSTASQISLGALGVAGSISQNVYFNSPSNSGDEFNVRLGVDPALLNVGLLNKISVSAYNGNNLVYSEALTNSLLGLDLIGLLNSGQVVNIPFSPGSAFDRVKITLTSLLNVNVTQTISVYGVTRSAPRPTFSAPYSNAMTACYNTGAVLGATTAATNQLIWYAALDGGAPLATTAFNGTYTTVALTANKTYYVAAKKIGCPDESARVAVNVTVNPAIVLPTTTLANAIVATAFSKQITLATGGTGPYTYAFEAGGTLPPGITLSSTGLLSGTPTTAGTYTFGISATDSKNCKVTTPHTLKVNNALVLGPLALPNGTVGTLYPTQVIPAATGGSTPYVYTATNLPPGLSFNATTREITGTPTTAGTFVVPVKVTDGDGNIVIRDYTIIVKDPLSIPAATLADGTVNTPYTIQTIPAAIGGTTPYTYAATNLPPGLSFNTTTREITGTPTTVGTFIVAVTVTDAENKTVNRNYSIKVTEALSLPAKTLADGTVGAVYVTETLPAALGGVGPYTYAAVNVPPGLSFNTTTRQVSGTPTQAGNYSIQLTATDSEGKTVSNNYALKVIGALSLPTMALPDGTVGDVYPVQILPAVTGGTAPYTYVASNLPPGLSFNATTREITGTPTVGGNYSISLKVTDANSNVANTNYAITIKVKAPIAANVTTCNGTSATLTVSNLQAGVTYNWYGPTGNTPLTTNNNGTYTTAVLNANTTFYVEAVSGTGVSSKTAVNVTINASPNLPTITTNNQVVNSGQNTVLQASADAGLTINWYGVATGGTLLGTGTSFTTPNLSTTTTYYAETVNANGCKSATRAPVTVTVTTGGGGTACNAANSQNTGIISLLCVLCNITGPTNSTDADPNNFTKITLSVGVAATGYQRLIFPTAGLSTDSIRLDLATPTGLLDLSVLSGITVKVMNGSTVVSSYPLNSSLIYLQLLSGNRFKATVPAGADFDRVEVSFSAVVAALSSLDIYGAEIIYPKPTIAASGQSVCSGSTAALSATPNGGTTLTWYSAATGGTLLATGNTYTSPALTASTIYYIQVSRNGCANPERVPVNVTVVPVLAVPVVAAVGASCEGSAVVLSVTSPDPTITYKWYDVATGGTSLFSGASFTTPALTASKTYYVEATKLGCTSATRAAVPVTVNPRPSLPQVQSSVSTITAGQTVILTATSTDSNVDFNWYTSANATAPVYTGATYVTPPLNATTTFYVDAKSKTNGCVSASRVAITINVDNGGTPNPVPCEGAAAETNGVNGVALLSGVVNSGLAIDNDTQTASTLLMPVGALNASVYQRLTFGSAGNIGDAVKVLISSPGKLLSLALLGNVEISTSNGGVSNNDAVSLGGALVSLELLSGNTQALVTIVPTKAFDAVEIKLNSGVLGALTSIGVNYAQHVIAAPEVTTANATACLNQATTLSVKNPKANLTYKWYDATGVYQTGKDGVSFTTPALSANTKYFVAASSSTGCLSAKSEINVTITPAPVAPTLLSNDVTTCSGNNVVLQVKDPIAGITYKWYNAAGVYQTGKDGTSFTIASVTANTTYAVEAVNACGLASARTTATVKVGTLDPPIVTPASVSISSGSVAILTATSSTANAVINWYQTATSTTILATGNSYITPTLTTTTTFYAEASVPGGCASVRVPVVVTVIPGGPPTTVPCGSATIAVADGVSGVALLAGVFNPGLAVDDKIETASSLVMPVGALGAYVYQRVGFTGGLSNIGDALRIKITSPGKLLSLGVLPSIGVVTYKGAVSNNDLMFASNPLINIELLSDNSSAILTFIPTAQFDGVEVRLNSGLLGALTSVDLNYAQRIVAAPQVNATTASACQGASATLSIKNPTVGVTYKWYLETTYQTGKDGTSFTTPTTLVAGTYNYYVTASSNGCESLPTKVVVTILPLPAPPVAAVGNPTSVCFGTAATLSVQQVAGITYKWYDASGTVLVVNNNTYTTPTNLPVGTYDFFVEAVNGNSCSSAARTKITLSVGSSALAADIQVSGTTSICGSTTTTLTASSTTVNNPIFTWYSDANLTTVVFTGAVFTTPVLTVNTTYYVTVKGTNKCENKPADAKIVALTVNPPATSADITVSTPPPACGSTSVTLAASTTTVTNPIFTWYSNAALTTVVATGNSFTTPTLTATTTYYVTVKGSNKCENTAATAKTVVVVVNPNAVAADITVSGNLFTCQNNSSMLTASSTTVTNPIFTWYSNANLTNVVFVGSVFITPVLTANTTYYVTVKGDNKCENLVGAAKDVTITINTGPLTPIISTTGTTICAGNATILTIQNAQTGVSYEWYNDATAGTLLFTGSSFTTPILNVNTDYYVRAVGTTGCTGTTARVKATVTITTKPNTPTLNASTINACAGSTATITVTNAVAGITYIYYSSATSNIPLGTGAIFTTPVLTANTVYFVEASAGSCISSGRAQVNITVNASPVAPSSLSSSNTSPCSGSTVVLSVNNPDANLTYRWYTTSTGGTALFEGNSYTTAPLATTTTYYVESVAKTGGCASPTRTSITVTVAPVLATPVVRVETVTNNSILFSWNAVSGATSYEVSTNNGTTWIASTGTSYLASGLQAGQSVTIIVRAKGQLGCQTSANSTPTTGTATNPSSDDLYVPNTFTPNGDGRNDVFYAYGTVMNFKIRIYNQWGQFVFESLSITQGWDGTFKGTLQPSGVYVYYIDVTFNSGNSKMLKGTITLLR